MNISNIRILGVLPINDIIQKNVPSSDHDTILFWEKCFLVFSWIWTLYLAEGDTNVHFPPNSGTFKLIELQVKKVNASKNKHVLFKERLIFNWFRWKPPPDNRRNTISSTLRMKRRCGQRNDNTETLRNDINQETLIKFTRSNLRLLFAFITE